MTPFDHRDVAWKRIDDANMLPRLSRVLTDANGRMPLNVSDRESVALASMSDGTVVMFAAIDADPSPIAVAMTRARHEGLTPRLHYHVSRELLRLIYAHGETGGSDDMKRTDMDGPIDQLLTIAMKRGATDVHFNGAENTADIYIRIHGELVRIDQIPHATYKKMTRALYVAGQGHDAKDWSEDHYLDTSIERTIDGKRCRIRFSQRNAYPNTWDVSLRIYQLGQEAAQVSFNELGFEPHQIELMRFMLDQPKGAVLLVGPMNSGKSTTLKSMLEYLVDRHGMRAKIQTLENPVEYHIAGVRQSSVSARASNTEDDKRVWSRALSAMMRSDAQILMLGEIRDPETAAFAQELTATGHKLLATLHARNPFEAIERLLMSGLRREVIAGGGFLTGIVNLHLLPCICSRCAKTFAAVADSLPTRLRKGLEAAADTYGDLSSLRFRGDGCDACQHLGTIGRTPVAEFLIPDEAVNESIRMDRRDIAEKAFADGSAGIPASIPVPYRTLLDHALTKAFRGVVDPVDVDVQVGAIIAPSKPQQPLRSIAGGQ